MLIDYPNWKQAVGDDTKKTRNFGVLQSDQNSGTETQPTWWDKLFNKRNDSTTGDEAKTKGNFWGNANNFLANLGTLSGNIGNILNQNSGENGGVGVYDEDDFEDDKKNDKVLTTVFIIAGLGIVSVVTYKLIKRGK